MKNSGVAGVEVAGGCRHLSCMYSGVNTCSVGNNLNFQEL